VSDLFDGLFSDVIVGLIGAVIIALITLVATQVRDAVIARRYPIAGQFRSTFEDSENGAVTVTKATATLKQRGHHIWGPTTLIGGERTWNLDGRVDKGARIWGKYTAEDPNDTGLGGFFLELHNDGHLEGMWTGYDSANRLVSAGRYVFWPMEKIETRDLLPTHLDGALSVLGNALGARYVTREELTEFVEHDDKLGFVALTKDGRVVGAATSHIHDDASSVLTLLPEDASDRVARLLPNLRFNRTGLLRSIAVSSKARGNGVGTNLVRASVEALWQRGATSILSIGWTDADGCHIQGPLESVGFTAHGDLPDFWKRDSVEKDYQCPTCGQPCECVARIFTMDRA
jgi:GNAT superfamily N-acetyltransferase